MPQNLSTLETIWLVFEGIAGTGGIWLNGELLVAWPIGCGAIELEVTGKLQARNVLSVELEAESDAGGLCGEVVLEIRQRQAPPDHPSR